MRADPRAEVVFKIDGDTVAVTAEHWDAARHLLKKIGIHPTNVRKGLGWVMATVSEKDDQAAVERLCNECDLGSVATALDQLDHAQLAAHDLVSDLSELARPDATCKPKASSELSVAIKSLVDSLQNVEANRPERIDGLLKEIEVASKPDCPKSRLLILLKELQGQLIDWRECVGD